jgi:hypothetical protein
VDNGDFTKFFEEVLHDLEDDYDEIRLHFGK